MFLFGRPWEFDMAYDKSRLGFRRAPLVTGEQLASWLGEDSFGFFFTLLNCYSVLLIGACEEEGERPGSKDRLPL